jgi:amino acid adenylation domain-containing protein
MQNPQILEQSFTLHQRFEHISKLYPDRLAVVLDGEGLTFDNLNRRANRIAHHLQSLDLETGSVIGLFLQRTPDLIAAMFAVLKYGCCFVALDSNNSPMRADYILNNTCVKVLLTTPEMDDKTPNGDFQKIILNDFNNLSETNLSVAVSPEDSALIICTSGSTGNPKGVVYSHLGYLARLDASSSVSPILPDERMSQSSPVSSIDAIDEILLPLLYGFTTLIIPDAVVRTPHLLLGALANYHITRMLLVPTLLRFLLEIQPETGIYLHDLKTWWVGGEILSGDLAARFYKAFPHATLINFYGLSEGDISCYFVPKDVIQPAIIPIGQAIKNRNVYILDSGLEPVLPGESGEICVTGEGLANGYQDQPELTTQRFIANPFDPGDSYLFRTGDLGRRLPDGSMLLEGRIDRQVKVNGYRVELAGIESVLRQHPDVKDCVVCARVRKNGTVQPSAGVPPILIAYIIPHNGQTVSYSNVRQHLLDKLPDYAVPPLAVFLRAFPLTSTGKIDQEALPYPENLPEEAGSPYQPPHTETEEVLARIWESVLKVHPVYVNQDFFDLGGDSFAAIETLIKTEKAFNVRLSIDLFIDRRTIAAFALEIERIKALGKTGSFSSLVAIKPGGTRLPLFCVHADGGVIFYQKFASLLNPDQPMYALQAQGLDGKTTPLRSVEEMAARYIREMKTVQPHGPYQVAAFSMGGFIAYEMCQQLIDAGEEVGLLALFDAYGPDYPRLLSTSNKLQYKISTHLNSLKQYDFQGKLGYFRRRIYKRAGIIYSHILSYGYKALKLPIPHTIRYNVVRESLNKAVDRYSPKAYPGRITLFRASVQPKHIISDPYLGWKELAIGGIEVEEITGNHNSILRPPHLLNLTARLEDHLDGS